jgi:hypothetical protein
MRVVSDPNTKIKNLGYYHDFASYEELKQPKIKNTIAQKDAKLLISQ